MDEIRIENLRLRCMIGFSDHELKHKQDVVINLCFFTNLRRAGETDNPDDILNYRTVNKAVIAHVEESHYKTVEALATGIAKVAILECGVPQLRVEVYKPGALRFADNVGVVIERSASDFS
jgi:FolB domain-containing protein